MEESEWNDNSTTLRQMSQRTCMRPLVFSSLKIRVNEKSISRICLFFILKD